MSHEQQQCHTSNDYEAWREKDPREDSEERRLERKYTKKNEGPKGKALEASLDQERKYSERGLEGRVQREKGSKGEGLAPY